MNKSYAEFKGYAPFNWLTFLNTVKRGDDTLWAKTELAADWVTCACGNQCSIIPRTFGVPDDLILRNLGIDFAVYIENMYSARELETYFNKFRTLAIQTLELIEKRSIELITELNPSHEIL